MLPHINCLDPVQEEIAQSVDFCMKVKQHDLKVVTTNNILYTSHTPAKKKKEKVSPLFFLI
jgi:hypothetical protein